MFDEELAAVATHPPRIGVLPGMHFRYAVPASTRIMLIAFVIFFGAFPLSIMSTDPKAKLEFGPSRTSEGHVVSTTDSSGCRDSRGRRIVYSFLADGGQEFRGTSMPCEDSPYHSAQVGDKIEIRYLVRDPAVNDVAGSESNQPPIFVFAFFPMFFLLFLSPLYLPQIREVMRARRLYKKGTLADGRVIFVKKRGGATWPGWPGSGSADVYVAYQIPGGGRAESVAWCSNDWLVNQLSPGTPVRILLSGKKSQRGVLLEAFVR
jgi:hypothetical protein